MDYAEDAGLACKAPASARLDLEGLVVKQKFQYHFDIKNQLTILFINLIWSDFFLTHDHFLTKYQIYCAGMIYCN